MFRIGLLGYPLTHSISPLFQQAALDHCGLEGRYQLWETEPSALAAVVAQLRQPDCLGANVTVPHKEVVVPLLDEVDELASAIGAVNTIVNKDGHLVGYNTDAEGFMRGLEEDGGFQPARKRVVILG
ncbi:MAG: shikimate dehydrogenase, partial [Chloroflexi bacterium]|nr:shikimate dehydrogenase [Chloroflexota bacterium]